MKHFLITGTGRCGTTYCAEVLRACGINCGHQAVFNHEGVLARRWDWGNYKGDSSFEAVPILPLLCRREPKVRIVVLRRNVDAVVASWRRLGMFDDQMREKFFYLSQVLDRHFPTVLKQATSEARGATFYNSWMSLACSYADAIIEVDRGLTPQILFDALQLKKIPSANALLVPQDTNTSVSKPCPE